MATRVDDTISPASQGRFWKGFARFWSNIAPARAAEARSRAAALFLSANLPVELGEMLVGYAGALPPESEDDAQKALAEAWPLIERAGRPRVLAEYNSICAFRVCFSNPALAREHYESALRHFRSAGAERSALGIANNLADCTWGTGDLDAAIASMRDAIALIRRSSTSAKSPLGLGLGNLAGVLTERGDLGEAFAAMSEAIPLISEIGWFYRFGDHFALRLAKAGHAEAAARLLGYTDGEHARFERDRAHNEARARASLLGMLNEAMAPAELAQRMAEGAKLTEDEAAQLALRGETVALGNAVRLHSFLKR